jgi:multidrug resistance efflux pump
VAAALLLSLAAGCHRPAPAPEGGPKVTEVSVTRPEKKTVRRWIKQPGYNIEAYQQTPLYAKVAGFVQKVYVDIGDRVKGPEYDSTGKLVREGQILADLWVPELGVELKEKEAAVRQAAAQVEQARKALGAAEANMKSAAAEVKQAEAGRLRVNADYAFRKSQYDRLTRLVGRGVTAQENADETRFSFEAGRAAVEEVEAKIQATRALRDESEAKRDKARADVDVQRERLGVAEAARDNVQTLLLYTKIRAPFDGVVTRRTVDVGHFVQPAASSGSKAEPLFNVNQTDVVRVFVNVPELDAVWVRDGAPASIRALKGREFKGTVTRAAYALDPRARTLRTEIDLPNPGGVLRPGMYVYATILAERPGVWTLPASAVVTRDEESFCYRVENGKALRTPVQVGLSGAGLVEVLKKQTRLGKDGAEGPWEDFTGEEEIVQGNVDSLKDGQAVTPQEGGK